MLFKWFFLNGLQRGQIDSRRIRESRKAQFLVQSLFAFDGGDIHCHNQFGLSPDLTAGDDKHVGTIQSHGLVVGLSIITGEDTFEFHGQSLESVNLKDVNLWAWRQRCEPLSPTGRLVFHCRTTPSNHSHGVSRLLITKSE